MKCGIISKFKKDPSSKDHWRSDTGSFIKKPSNGWLHSNDAFKTGVNYETKYVGAVKILESMRMFAFNQRGDILREAISKCCIESKIYNFKKSKVMMTYYIIGDVILTNSGEKVLTNISTKSIKSTLLTGEVIFEHMVENISFCALGEKQYKNFIGYISKDVAFDRACFVFECGNDLSNNIILSVGQAFELKYKKHLQTQPKIQPIVGRFTDPLFEAPEKGFYKVSPNIYIDSLKTKQYENLDDSNVKSSHYTALNFDDSLDCATIFDNPIASFEKSSFKIDELSKENFCSDSVDSLYENNNILEINYKFNKNTEYEILNKKNDKKSVDYDNLMEFFNDDRNLSQTFINNNNPLEILKDYDPAENIVDLLNTNTEYDKKHKIVDCSTINEGTKNIDYNIKSEEYLLFDKNDQEVSNVESVSVNGNFRAFKHNNMNSGKVEGGFTETCLISDNTVSKNLNQERWFHGLISRDSAKNLIKKNGQFLVRESATKQGQYILTGMRDGKLMNILLVDPEGKVRTRDHTFNTVSELIKFHFEHNIPISAGSQTLFLINEVPFF
ncbi:SHC-transforming protein 1 isoform X1 [Hydra vulgaris]|uniref:SHC-transforming protein 1 isoform X1 n=1 Tax=Hydra vulgaris TaxID=6087 RepID=UPI001F5E5782|nr:SHC-transforming protein 1-like [Hydra vulgaris]